VIECIVAAWLALAPAPAGPAEGGADLSEAQRLFDVGTGRYDAADYEGAIEAFTEALTELRGKGVDDFRIRGLLMFNIGRTHMRAFEIDEKIEHLKQAKSIFSRFIEEAEQHGDQVDAGDIEEAKAELIEIDRLLGGEADEPEPGPVDDSRERDAPDPARLRTSGIGLTAAGVAVLAGGIGMLAWGSAFGRKAEAKVAPLDDLGLPPESPAFSEADVFVAAERRKGTAWMASGGVAAAVGVVGLALGIRQLVRARRANEGSVSASASFGRQGVWIGLAGRF
jgi:tetratricopeptide (TPR) repeat protein